MAGNITPPAGGRRPPRTLHTGAGRAARAAERLTAITHVVEIVDGFLLAGFLLIFALGLYELFISRLEVMAGTTFERSILHVRSLDDLKTKLAKVILVMLVVKFFEQASAVPATTPLELLYAAGGVALIGLALWLAHAAEKGGGEDQRGAGVARAAGASGPPCAPAPPGWRSA